jgi:hypothetical protein
MKILFFTEMEHATEARQNGSGGGLIFYVFKFKIILCYFILEFLFGKNEIFMAHSAFLNKLF